MPQSKIALFSKIDKFTLLLVVMLLAAMVTAYSYYARIYNPSYAPNFYSLLGEAFMAGQTHIEIPPRRELATLPNPYEPRLNWRYRLHDASLYNGKYYLYYGPVPALLPWIPVKYLTGISLSDSSLALCFAVVGTVCLTWLLVSIAMHQRMVVRWGLVFAVLSLCFGTWLPFLLRRPFFYEVAISGAYCFSALGLLCLWQGFWRRQKTAYCWQLVAGLCFGLAMGCRITHVFTIAILIIAWVMMRRTQTARTSFLQLICMFGPWLLCLAGLTVYNYVRFGSVFESGLHYQLTIFDFHTPGFKLISFNHVLDNAYFYLLRPLTWRNNFVFPFFHVNAARIALPWDAVNAMARTDEPLYGLFTNNPFSFWLLAMPYCLVKRHRLSPETRAILTGIALYGVSLLCFLLFFFFTTMRYGVDFAPWLVFLASVQYLQLLSIVKTKRIFFLLLVAGGVTALYGAFTGTMSAYCGCLQC